MHYTYILTSMSEVLDACVWIVQQTSNSDHKLRKKQSTTLILSKRDLAKGTRLEILGTIAAELRVTARQHRVRWSVPTNSALRNRLHFLVVEATLLVLGNLRLQRSGLQYGRNKRQHSIANALMEYALRNARPQPFCGAKCTSADVLWCEMTSTVVVRCEMHVHGCFAVRNGVTRALQRPNAPRCCVALCEAALLC